MKKTVVALVAVILFELAALAGLSSAQGGTTPPQGSSPSFAGGSGSCDTPAAGKTVICGTSTGVLVSVNGGAFVSTQGQAGPQGVAGPQGPAGPAGTSASFTSFVCSSMIVSSTGISGSGCVFNV